MNKKVLMEARELISGFLKNRREELGLSQAKLAEVSGLGIATIKRLEGNKFPPNIETVMVLCHHLRCYFFVSEMESNEEFSKLMRERWTRIADEN